MKSRCFRSMRTLLYLAMSLVATSFLNANEPNQSIEGTEAFQELIQELNVEHRKWFKRFREAQSDEERSQLRLTSPHRLFEPRFLTLAQRSKNDNVAFAALRWLVENASPGPVFDQGLEELREHHLQHTATSDICRTLVNRRSPEIEHFLQYVGRHHPKQEVQAVALLSLARHLAGRLDAAKLREREKKRIERVCRAIVRDYGGLPDKVYREHTGELRTFTHAVNALQFSLDPIGRPAPSFVGKDANGESVRSQDLRGRIALIMFSADWCGPCKEMYGQLRELTEIYAEFPFSVVTVMADSKVESVAKAVESGEISWTAVWDGPNGPIASAWNVTSYPTIYIVDRSGMIRSSGLRDDDLDNEVAESLGIDPGSRTKRDKRTRAWSLSLRQQGIDDNNLRKRLEGYTNLRVLDLSHNQISDENLTHLLPLKKLTVLNLQHTGITDEGLKVLKAMSSLRRLHLYAGPNHKTTTAGRRALRNAIPGLQVSLITH